ncbi:Inner membrane protein YgaZ [uncultured Coprococcus sp.]|jgi:hypothetical protein|uniref:AzlC family ABC transporter permease n=1 Tax=Coprococcus ammoniilyticus TaxID=2981785 RepID=UPI0008213358|nr:AzlC family ABC transporter permease [Coprococcus ammoniilyticus]MCU6731663.1 AzlC family ABC transporter permease [Coprococcus ammoniilyticus]SCI26273.1 Inner membrane protein YgaZ [uncultured Coprococcus sp.]
MTGETVDRKEVLKQAFVKALPITGSYLFVSMAYGLMMQEAGLSWFWSLFTSLTVYTGAFQFVLVTFLSSGASILTIALTALFMNSRQFFYGLTFVEDFKKMGKRYPYMVHTMTDETYKAENADCEKRQEQIKVQNQQNYEKYHEGQMSREEFLSEKKQLEEEKERLERRKKELEELISGEKEILLKKNIPVEQMMEFLGYEKLTEEMLEKYVDGIYVYDDGRVKIKYK